MARLITINEIKDLGLSWYFPELTDRSQLVLPAGDFQYVLGINNEVFKDTLSHRVSIRKFIESALADNVLINVTQKDYLHYYGTHKSKYDWDHYNVSWGFHEFWFQNEADMILFKIKFAELISEITPYNPECLPGELQEADYYKKEAEERLKKYIDDLDDAEVQYIDNKKEVIKKKKRKFDKEVIDRLVKEIDDDDIEPELVLVDGDGKDFICKSLNYSLIWTKRLKSAEVQMERAKKRHNKF